MFDFPLWPLLPDVRDLRALDMGIAADNLKIGHGFE